MNSGRGASRATFCSGVLFLAPLRPNVLAMTVEISSRLARRGAKSV